MPAPTKNKNTSKKFGPLKIFASVILIVFLLGVCSDGELLEDIQDMLGFRDSSHISDSQLSGDDTLQGDDTTGNGQVDGDASGGGNADNSGSASGDNSGSGNSGGGTSGGNTDNSGNSGEDPAAGKATYGQGSRPNVPAASKNNVFLNARDQGISATLTGDVLITTVFVSDKATNWTAAEMNKIKSGHKTMTDAINAEAKKWGVSLNLTLEYRTASVTYDLANDAHASWYQSALKSAGLTANASVDLEKSRKVKEAPVLFYLDLTGRAFATPTHSKSSRTEYAVFYSGDSGAANYRHELYHLFGAKDYYYPDEVSALGKKYFPNSTMLSGSGAVTDSLTAYLIGWTDQLDADAKVFLQETDWVTSEYLKAEHEKETYTGYVENWRMNNATYTGYLVDGIQQGKGTMVWDDGGKYVGNWNYGQLHGQGTFTWATGAVYTGNFKNGVREGTGRYTFPNGSWYEGAFKDGKFHGQGTYHWTSGNQYVGQWKSDQCSGQGKLTYADGSWYEGAFKEGKFNGQGTRVYANGSKYVGQWKNNKYHGKGKLTYASGAWYEGDYSAGKRHGQGTYVYPNGDSYVGQWSQDQRHGQGTYTFANGSQKSGQWSENQFVGS